MHRSFLPYLKCPKSGEDLQIKIITQEDGEFILEGMLSSSLYEYPIIRGIPRFVQLENYAESFGTQWNRWPRLQFDSENIGKPMAGHTEKMFSRIIGKQISELKNEVIVDVGCGPGRFIDRALAGGAKVIGIDYSSAVEPAQKNFFKNPNVLIVQGDALQLPIKENSINGAFSIGVLHHTPRPEKGMIEISKILKDGGWAAVCVYGKNGYYDSPRVTVWRKFLQCLKPVFGNLPPLIYSHFTTWIIYPLSFIPGLGHVLRLTFPSIRLPDWKWRLLDTHDSVTPKYQSAHESFEVYSWFKKAGFSDIEPSDWGFSSFHARRFFQEADSNQTQKTPAYKKTLVGFGTSPNRFN